MPSLYLLILTLASGWASFRGPNGSGVAESAKPPLSWSESRNIRWKLDLPGLAHASPIVHGGRVYALTAVARQGNSKIDLSASDKVVFASDAVPHEWRMLAIEEKSGRILWDRVLHEATPRGPRHAKGTYANATPATNGKYIVAALGSEVVVGLDRDGKILWKHDLGVTNPKDSLDPSSSPVIFENLAIMQSDFRKDGYIAAYDLASGKQVWRVARTEGYSWSTPAITPQGELVANSPKWIRAYDARTGREKWRVDNSVKPPYDRIPVPVIAGDRVIISGGGGNGQFFAVKLGGEGELKPEWSVTRSIPYMPSPVEYKGLLYAINDNGILRVYRATDGSLVYEQRVSGARVSASPVAAGGRVYIVDEDGDTYVVRAGETYELLSKNSIGELCMSTPAISGSTLLLRSSARLWAIR